MQVTPRAAQTHQMRVDKLETIKTQPATSMSEYIGVKKTKEIAERLLDGLVSMEKSRPRRQEMLNTSLTSSQAWYELQVQQVEQNGSKATSEMKQDLKSAASALEATNNQLKMTNYHSTDQFKDPLFKFISNLLGAPIEEVKQAFQEKVDLSV